MSRWRACRSRDRSVGAEPGSVCPPAEAFTPWFKLIAARFLFPWWQQLLDRREGGKGKVDALSLKDLRDDEIHRML